MGNLLNIFALIIVVGVLMWLINVYIPMSGPIKSLLNLLSVVVVIIYILQFFTIIPPILPMYNLVKG